MEDAPLSDLGDANEDIETVDAQVIEAERPDSNGGFTPRHSLDPEEVLEQGRHPKILRMTLLSLTGKCSKASRQ